MDRELELRMAAAAGNTDAVGKINRRFAMLVAPKNEITVLHPEDSARESDGTFSDLGDHFEATESQKDNGWTTCKHCGSVVAATKLSRKAHMKNHLEAV